MKSKIKTLSVFTLFLTTHTAFATEDIKQDFERVSVVGSRFEGLKITNPSTTTLRKEDFEQQQILHTDNLWELIPNLNTAGGSNRIRYIQIRGVGERSEYDSVPTQSVGYYYDHIDLSGSGGISTTFDVEKLEVLKGPQSYLYGDSSIGGNILIQSSSPQNEKKAFILGTGSQNLQSFSLQFNKEITENLSFKIGAQKHKSSGFYKNTFLNKKTSKQNEIFINAGSSLNIGSLIFDSRHIFSYFKNGYDVWNAYSNNFDTFTDKPGRDNQKTYGHSIEATVPLTKVSTLTFIGSTAQHQSFYSYDEDWGNNIFWNSLSGYNDDYDYNKSYNRHKKNTHLKAIYQQTFKSTLWSLGTHFYQRGELSTIKSYKDSNLREELKTKYKSDHLAFFSSLEKKILNNLKANLNVRFEKQKIDYNDNTGFKDKISNNLFGFNIGALYKLNPLNDIKLTVSRGFKGAGLNPDINLSEEQKRYAPESLVNYELHWLRNSKHVEHQITLFYMNRNNQQISTSTQSDPLNPSDFTIYTDNASKSENYGLETSSSFFINKFLNIKISTGLLTARFKKYSREGVVYDGRGLAHAPKQSYSLILNLKPHSKLNFSISGSRKSSFYFSNSHDQKSKSYNLLNANIAYHFSKHTSLHLWGKNLLDEKYATRGFYFPNRPPDWSAEVYTQNGHPLSWGASLSLKL